MLIISDMLIFGYSFALAQNLTCRDGTKALLLWDSFVGGKVIMCGLKTAIIMSMLFYSMVTTSGLARKAVSLNFSGMIPAESIDPSLAPSAGTDVPGRDSSCISRWKRLP